MLLMTMGRARYICLGVPGDSVEARTTSDIILTGLPETRGLTTCSDTLWFLIWAVIAHTHTKRILLDNVASKVQPEKSSILYFNTLQTLPKDRV